MASSDVLVVRRGLVVSYATSICAAIGVASGGIGGVVCALVVVGGASVAGSAGGGWAGELAGEKVYQRSQ
ncbi:hypothetical protein EGJ29_19585 [Pseudomonas sp. s199]|nr:hypothetical protein EGJ29_19585 [Pseudomonas sp. s199]